MILKVRDEQDFNLTILSSITTIWTRRKKHEQTPDERVGVAVAQGG